METTYKTTIFSIIVLTMIIPNIVTSFHIHIPMPHISIPKPHIHFPKPHIHIPNYPKIIIQKICEKIGHEKDCLKRIKRPLCIDKIIAIPGCFKDIHKIVHHRRHGNLGVDCCNTVLGVGANACLSLVLPGIPDIMGLIMSESCWQIYQNTPPPPHVVRPKQLAGSEPDDLPPAADSPLPTAVSPAPESD